METRMYEMGRGQGYEDRQLDFVVGEDDVVGSASWDKNQNLYVGSLSKVKMKNLYRKTKDGMHLAIEEAYHKSVSNYQPATPL